jgi:hypothetical protein
MRCHICHSPAEPSISASLCKDCIAEITQSVLYPELPAAAVMASGRTMVLDQRHDKTLENLLDRGELKTLITAQAESLGMALTPQELMDFIIKLQAVYVAQAMAVRQASAFYDYFKRAAPFSEAESQLKELAQNRYLNELFEYIQPWKAITATIVKDYAEGKPPTPEISKKYARYSFALSAKLRLAYRPLEKKNLTELKVLSLMYTAFELVYFEKNTSADGSPRELVERIRGVDDPQALAYFHNRISHYLRFCKEEAPHLAQDYLASFTIANIQDIWSELPLDKIHTQGQLFTFINDCYQKLYQIQQSKEAYPAYFTPLIAILWKSIEHYSHRYARQTLLEFLTTGLAILAIEEEGQDLVGMSQYLIGSIEGWNRERKLALREILKQQTSVPLPLRQDRFSDIRGITRTASVPVIIADSGTSEEHLATSRTGTPPTPSSDGSRPTALHVTISAESLADLHTPAAGLTPALDPTLRADAPPRRLSISESRVMPGPPGYYSESDSESPVDDDPALPEPSRLHPKSRSAADEEKEDSSVNFDDLDNLDEDEKERLRFKAINYLELSAPKELWRTQIERDQSKKPGWNTIQEDTIKSVMQRGLNDISFFKPPAVPPTPSSAVVVPKPKDPRFNIWADIIQRRHNSDRIWLTGAFLTNFKLFPKKLKFAALKNSDAKSEYEEIAAKSESKQDENKNALADSLVSWENSLDQNEKIFGIVPLDFEYFSAQGLLPSEQQAARAKSELERMEKWYDYHLEDNGSSAKPFAASLIFHSANNTILTILQNKIPLRGSLLSRKALPLRISFSKEMMNWMLSDQQQQGPRVNYLIEPSIQLDNFIFVIQNPAHLLINTQIGSRPVGASASAAPQSNSAAENLMGLLATKFNQFELMLPKEPIDKMKPAWVDILLACTKVLSPQKTIRVNIDNLTLAAYQLGNPMQVFLQDFFLNLRPDDHTIVMIASTKEKADAFMGFYVAQLLNSPIGQSLQLTMAKEEPFLKKQKERAAAQAKAQPAHGDRPTLSQVRTFLKMEYKKGKAALFCSIKRMSARVAPPQPPEGAAAALPPVNSLPAPFSLSLQDRRENKKALIETHRISREARRPFLLLLDENNLSLLTTYKKDLTDFKCEIYVKLSRSLFEKLISKQISLSTFISNFPAEASKSLFGQFFSSPNLSSKLVVCFSYEQLANLHSSRVNNKVFTQGSMLSHLTEKEAGDFMEALASRTSALEVDFPLPVGPPSETPTFVNCYPAWADITLFLRNYAYLKPLRLELSQVPIAALSSYKEEFVKALNPLIFKSSSLILKRFSISKQEKANFRALDGEQPATTLEDGSLMLSFTSEQEYFKLDLLEVAIGKSDLAQELCQILAGTPRRLLSSPPKQGPLTSLGRLPAVRREIPILNEHNEQKLLALFKEGGKGIIDAPFGTFLERKDLPQGIVRLSLSVEAFRSILKTASKTYYSGKIETPTDAFEAAISAYLGKDTREARSSNLVISLDEKLFGIFEDGGPKPNFVRPLYDFAQALAKKFSHFFLEFPKNEQQCQFFYVLFCGLFVEDKETIIDIDAAFMDPSRLEELGHLLHARQKIHIYRSQISTQPKAEQEKFKQELDRLWKATKPIKNKETYPGMQLERVLTVLRDSVFYSGRQAVYATHLENDKNIDYYRLAAEAEALMPPSSAASASASVHDSALAVDDPGYMGASMALPGSLQPPIHSEAAALPLPDSDKPPESMIPEPEVSAASESPAPPPSSASAQPPPTEG